MRKLCGRDVHPAADLFPMMEEAELVALAEDIGRHGQREAISTFGGAVVDGRNRLEACRRAGVKPWVIELRQVGGETLDVVGFVLSANLHRRHLTPSQRAVIAVEAQLLAEKLGAKARQRGSAQGRDLEPGKAAAKVAAAAKVGTRTVERVLALQERPEMLQRVRDGELNLRKAEKMVRREAQLAQVRAYVPPSGKYPVIAVDPPWEFDDELDGMDRELPYPPMTVEEICAVQIPAAPDCILWLWTTNTHLLDGSAKRVLDAWGFTPKVMATWGKDRLGMGHWLRGRTEHVILAVKGKPVVELGTQSTLFPGKVRAHSQKPEEFFRLVEDLCPATPRLELFARKPREGWVTSGAEMAGSLKDSSARAVPPAARRGAGAGSRRAPPR